MTKLTSLFARIPGAWCLLSSVSLTQEAKTGSDRDGTTLVGALLSPVRQIESGIDRVASDDMQVRAAQVRHLEARI